jgi:hypothetical protein
LTQDALVRTFNTDMELQKREVRSEILDPDLVNENGTQGWAFAIPSSFKAAFDIRWDIRRENGSKRETWTQGSNYCFSCGDVLYDSPKGYEVWSAALQHINTCLQVVTAIPARLGSDGRVTFQVSHPNKQRTSLVAGNIYTCSQVEFVALLRTGRLDQIAHFEL